MEADAAPGIVYGLEHPARCLAAVSAELDTTRFLVGTLSISNENQIHVLDYQDDDQFIDSQVVPHPAGEVWHLSTSPSKADVFCTCFADPSSTGSPGRRAVLWRLPEERPDGSFEDGGLTQLLELKSESESEGGGAVKSVVWNPVGDDRKLISLDDTHIHVWDVGAGLESAKCAAPFPADGELAKNHPGFTTAVWVPHQNGSLVTTASGTSIVGWDLRQRQVAYTISGAHGQFVRDLDFNPNKQYHLVSAGDDCLVKFFDVRQPTAPLLTLSEHSHWVWQVEFNQFHDQMVLSGSSDSHIVLHNVISLSSDPVGTFSKSDSDEDEGGKESEEMQGPRPDGVIKRYEEHEDSVYAVAWSTVDPWVFASLSYDGRLVMNHVPREEKYNILVNL